MSLRTDVVQALKSALGSRYAITGLRTVDVVTKRALLVYQESLTPTEAFAPTVRAQLAVWILVPQEKPDAADDALDEALEDVLGVVHPMQSLTWTSAERGVFQESWHGYKLTVVAGGQITTA